MTDSERHTEPEETQAPPRYQKPEVRDLGSLLDLTHGIPGQSGPDALNAGSQ